MFQDYNVKTGRIGRARSSLVIFLETKKLMVVLGCSKGGESAFGMPLSVGIQFSKCFESIRWVPKSIHRWTEKKSDLKRLQGIDLDVLRVNSVLERVWKKARESIRGDPESIHWCPELVFDVQNPLGVDSSSSESIPRVKNFVLERK
ncbi:hypothetical protein PIB30_073673 [Stylosanthes scabra]|uniref:Uncharacterized protein n=1 Tax=Stylosanthes scabra TaxID=79078 RepID=A0ABU6QQ38_9FABA|nr:hypothetical protein [Stylosanthes scabra]